MKTNVSNENLEKEITKSIIPGNKLFFLFLGFVIVSFLGHFIFNNHWMKISVYHLGGLGITGLFACLTAFIANRKAYNYKKVLVFSFFLPIALGLLAVIIISLKVNFFYCGGGVVLAVSIILVILYSLIRKRLDK